MSLLPYQNKYTGVLIDCHCVHIYLQDNICIVYSDSKQEKGHHGVQEGEVEPQEQAEAQRGVD